MVCWYDPRQLLKTGVQVVVSTLFARNSDRRLTDAAATANYSFHDFSTVGKDAVVDYVADTGDGWNSTYAVAYWVTREKLQVAEPRPAGADPAIPARLHDTRRGDILVFGGDQVYPAASAQGYDRRLVAPYEAALQWSFPPHPTLFAIPGNHDWFDNLVAFSQRFVARSWLAGWETLQNRSYFALKLPHGWWLVGSDVQLESELDQRQVDFFRDLATKHMQPDDRIVLCTAEPHWVYEHEMRGTAKYERSMSNLRFLEEVVFGKRIRAFVSGDLHHYRRYSDGRVEKITAGGGGAFLHPTHGMREDPLPGGFALQATFPDERTSRRLGWRNLLFLGYNPSFGALTGILSMLVYLVLAQVLAAWHPGEVLWRKVVLGIAQTPLAALLVIAVLAGFYAFTDTSARWYRLVGGLTHGAVQLLLPILTACAFRVSTARWEDPPLWFVALAPLGVQLVTGWVLGSCVMGLYLFVSLNLLCRHRNEAFSSLHCEDYKNFLRLRFDDTGVTIYPIGIARVPRSHEWVEKPGAKIDEPKLVPRGGTPPRLIESPIHIEN